MERMKNCFYGKKGNEKAANVIAFNTMPESAKRQLDIVGISSTSDYEDSDYRLVFVPHVNHIPMYITYLILLLTVVTSIVSKALYDAAYLFDNKYQTDVVWFNGSVQIELILCIAAYALFIIYTPFFIREFYDTHIKPYSLQLVKPDKMDY